MLPKQNLSLMNTINHVCLQILAFMISGYAPPGMTTGYLGEIQISTELSIDALSLAIVTTLAASIFPAWKASRMNVVDALRHQR